MMTDWSRHCLSWHGRTSPASSSLMRWMPCVAHAARMSPSLPGASRRSSWCRCKVLAMTTTASLSWEPPTSRGPWMLPSGEGQCFSSGWCLWAWESPHVLYPVSPKFPQHCLRNSVDELERLQCSYKMLLVGVEITFCTTMCKRRFLSLFVSVDKLDRVTRSSVLVWQLLSVSPCRRECGQAGQVYQT